MALLLVAGCASVPAGAGGRASLPDGRMRGHECAGPRTRRPRGRLRSRRCRGMHAARAMARTPATHTLGEGLRVGVEAGSDGPRSRLRRNDTYLDDADLERNGRSDVHETGLSTGAAVPVAANILSIAHWNRLLGVERRAVAAPVRRSPRARPTSRDSGISPATPRSPASRHSPVRHGRPAWATHFLVR